jgi:predicted GIY-YIG superfamily endonuclease
MSSDNVVPANAGTHNHRGRIFPPGCTTVSVAATYYVYILASRRHGTLYIGITNNLRARLEQHRTGQGSQFVQRCGVHRLVYTRGVRIAARSDRTRETIEELAA